jgi:poly(3-hydroxybutyrate) depolymerase
MSRLGIPVSAIALAWAATASAQTKSTLSLQVGGKARHASFFVPSAAGKPPVVFFVHGANGSGSNFENETKGDVTAEREKFIAVYPSASANGAAGVWDDMSGTGNFPFFLALIDSLDARYKIDRNRVYMTGFSQGGFISFVAGCRYSDVFAAVAPVSGHAGATCTTLKRPVPVYLTFGAGEGRASFENDIAIWRKLDSCPATPTVIRPYPASKPNSKVSRVSYGPCAGGTSVVMDSVSGQGHQWPTAQVQADEAWAFFKPFSLAGATAVRPAPAASRGSRSASYSAGVVSLEGIGDATWVRVTDTRGRVVATASASGGRFGFKGMPSGVYIVRAAGTEGFAPRKFLVP